MLKSSLKGVGLAATRPLPAWARARWREDEAWLAEADAILFGGTFNRWFEPENLRDAARVLRAGEGGRVDVAGQGLDAHDAVAEALGDLLQDGVAGEARDEGVEVVVCADVLREVVWGHPAHGEEVAVELRVVLRRGVGGSQLGGHGLEALAHGVGGHRLLQAELRDAHAAVGLYDDQPFLRELAHGLADGRARDLEGFGELLLAQPAARLERP